MKSRFDRRRFLATAAAAGAAASAATSRADQDKPAVLGGKPVRRAPFPSWPRFDQLDQKNILDVLHSGHWFRGGGDCVNRFEAAYAQLTGARHCVATANGTSALFASLASIGIEPGDEVIVPPYTFIATINVVLLQYALPVFVDTDPETFQIDARKVEAAITERTRAIIPVHLGGNVSDMDAILAIAAKHKLPVIEDACQAHLAEWRGKKVGNLGATGCFSFQVSKNLSSGEGGAILTADPDLAEKCYAFQNNNRARTATGYNFFYRGGRGANLRMTEFQGNLLLAQMTRLEKQSRTREQNAQYLTRLLREIPGIHPARMYEGCTRNAYHLYMFRYKSEEFGGLTRAKFLHALDAEGIPCSSGYGTLNKEPFIQAALNSRGFRRIFSKEILDGYPERNQCPANDQLCQEAVWFTQSMFLGTKSDMDQIAAAVRKIHAHAEVLARA
ncbi:MAG: DegT/DnrJ/EryC1/StrS family aminotransferase [Isosphaeraceae bacterium]